MDNLTEERITELCEQAFGQLYGLMNMPLVFKFAELIEQEVRTSAASYWNLPEQWLTEEDDNGLPDFIELEDQGEVTYGIQHAYPLDKGLSR